MILPSQLAAKGTEEAHQTALFAWCAVAAKFGPNVASAWDSGMGFEAAKTSYQNDIPLTELRWLYHIPNGGIRGDSKLGRQIRGGKLKAQGVKAGVPDLCLPIIKHDFSGLYIELKVGKNKPFEDQYKWIDHLVSNGYCARIVYGWEQAKETLIWYLNI